MVKRPISHSFSDASNAIDQDLVDAICLQEKTYGWQLDPNAGLEDLPEMMVELDSDLEPVLLQGSQVFFAHLEAYWQAAEATVSSGESVTARLQSLQAWAQHLRNPIPQSVLEQVVTQVSQIVTQPQAQIEAAVACVGQLLPQWSIEDLQVFNRPLSYAMRSPKTGMDAVLAPLQTKTWDNLSDFEQVRIYLALTNYTLAQDSQ